MNIFTLIITQPIFNLLVIIYNYIPGHDFGVAVIIFTALVRLALWPLFKKQLRQTKVMRKLQPELKRIKQEAKGDKQKESQMMMALYKEQGVNPLGSIGLLIIQAPIFIGLVLGLEKLVHDPHQLIKFSYSGIEHLSWIQHVSHHLGDFHVSLFGVVDLTRSAIGGHGFYLPAFILVVISTILTYYQTKQLQPTDKNARKLRDVLRSAKRGEQTDQSEMSAAVGRSTSIFMPAILFFFMINYTSALSLYILVSSLVAYLQQRYAFREDTEEMEEIADKKGASAKTSPSSDKKSQKTTATPSQKSAKDKKHAIIEGEIVDKTAERLGKPPRKTAKNPRTPQRKRRKK